MKRYVLPGLVLAALTLSAPYALAQDPAPDPQVVAITPQKACGTVTFNLVNADVGEYGFTFSTGPFAGGPIGAQGLIVVPAGETVTHTVRLPEDSFDGQGFVTLGVSYGPNTHRQAFLDLGLVDTDCEPPVDVTTPPTTPPATTETTAPPTTSAPAPTPDDDDFDQVGRAPVGGVATGG
ncbi:hypothetical protein I4I73_29000 [Pseudonocardia sp. KRD-184]|uniref:Uncharacterized protein n=1 Tax=Pseudonocardia oceani TaxID=2792013 RepID=A0ABS6UG38_9PSEU|nr:hypothetical protein [Pseudonocardia oceani]MBW0088215.1 hypothetical protein [Pseudonocardia oceani]MBW0100023.1 hypothetical protein [Pseudonocardia oceani]MBW0121150.1 hypothetical protein [Pseudonocardia oceani]MBW0131164.1 hypothetical protein [Pseudonocardia oceani]MBW0132574.1 hypothetical protein [Pseudonocardia oceani]